MFLINLCLKKNNFKFNLKKMFKKIKEEDKSQKLQNILSKFNEIKNTVTNLKKVSSIN